MAAPQCGKILRFPITQLSLVRAALDVAQRSLIRSPGQFVIAL
jgi:hypothetical protein